MNTRDEILAFLHTHAFSCAEELSAVFGMTRANIQHHLKMLEQERSIQRVSIKSALPARGRPRAYFALSPTNRANNFLPLLEGLLWILTGERDHAQVDSLLKNIAQQILPPGEKASSLTHRLTRTVKELGKLGYQARWEAHADGPQVLFRNCPYHPLPDQFRELCRMDAFLLTQNLGVPEVVQTARINIPSIPACSFLIKSK